MAAEVARIAAEADLELTQTIGRSEVELSASREEIRRGESAFGISSLTWPGRSPWPTRPCSTAGASGRPSRPGCDPQARLSGLPFPEQLVVGDLTGATSSWPRGRSASLDPDDNPGAFCKSRLRYAIAGGKLADAAWVATP